MIRHISNTFLSISLMGTIRFDKRKYEVSISIYRLEPSKVIH